MYTKKMSKTFVGILIASVIAVGFSTSAFAENTTGITVNVTGSVLADPDTSVITASIETIENTAETAKSLNNSLCSDLRNSMVAAGISEDKIVTEYTYVSPERKYDEKTDEYKIIGYRAYTSISFSTNDVDNAGKYIDVAVKNGATGVNISFSLESSADFYAQALKQAIATAESSAKAIADACGKPLGNVVSVNETTSNHYTIENASAKTMNDLEAVAEEGAGTEIDYDKISVTAHVTVNYDFK